MTADEFTSHIPIIADQQFEIEPFPGNIDRSHRLFTLDGHDDNHVRMVNDNDELLYLPLAAVEFINPGNPPTIVTYRKMSLQNQSFV